MCDLPFMPLDSPPSNNSRDTQPPHKQRNRRTATVVSKEDVRLAFLLKPHMKGREIAKKLGLKVSSVHNIWQGGYANLEEQLASEGVLVGEL